MWNIQQTYITTLYVCCSYNRRKNGDANGTFVLVSTSIHVKIALITTLFLLKGVQSLKIRIYDINKIEQIF